MKRIFRATTKMTSTDQAKQCIDDAAKRGISSGELEENLGTDLVDFISHELAITDVPGLPTIEKQSDPPTSVSGSDS